MIYVNNLNEIDEIVPFSGGFPVHVERGQDSVEALWATAERIVPLSARRNHKGIGMRYADEFIKAFVVGIKGREEWAAVCGNSLVEDTIDAGRVAGLVEGHVQGNCL